MTREHPILFSAPMVRAILAGAKTQTRRTLGPSSLDLLNDGRSPECVAKADCPHPVGTCLWVRETWRTVAELDSYKPRLIDEKAKDAGFSRGFAPFEYAADGARIGWTAPDWPEDLAPGRWRPSIFMPRWASRITLEVTQVRVQRLREINEDDARAEGVVPLQMDAGSCLPSFEGLWDSINVKRAPWASNPWVWAYTFRVVK